MKNALLDFAQGASNAAADTVAAPVDGIAWLLRKAGLPVPQAPLGGSDWMAQRGLRAKPRNALAGALGESAGLISPMVAAARAPQIANALLKAGENAAAPATVNVGGRAGQRGIFMGDLSKTWDKAAAEKAAAMEKAGADPRAIWQETGTFKGVDGKWRQEIDDSGSTMKGAAPFGELIMDKYRQGAQRTGDQLYKTTVDDVFFNHPLKSAYPDITGIETQMMPAGRGATASLSGDKDLVVHLASDVGPADGRSAMLHELQHAVQQRQGFSRGGSPMDYTQQKEAELARDALNWQREIKRVMQDQPRLNWKQAEEMVAKEYASIGWKEGIPSSEARAVAFNPMETFGDSLEDFVKAYGLDSRVTPRSPQEMYRSLAGEAEARAVQKRMNMNALQRRQTFPLDSYDVPLNELIVR